MRAAYYAGSGVSLEPTAVVACYSATRTLQGIRVWSKRVQKTILTTKGERTNEKNV
jgi:hypothetical protein